MPALRPVCGIEECDENALVVVTAEPTTNLPKGRSAVCGFCLEHLEYGFDTVRDVFLGANRLVPDDEIEPCILDLRARFEEHRT